MPPTPGETPSRTLTLIAVRSGKAAATDSWLEAIRPVVVAAGGSLWSLVGAPPPGGPGPGHSHVLRFDSPETLTAYDDAVTRGRRDGSIAPWHAEVRRDRWRSHGPSGPPTPGATGMIVAEVLCADPARHDEWDRWYDDEHLPDMMATGAFATGTRWRRDPVRPGGANDLTIYEVTGGTVQDAIERSAAAMPGLIAEGRKHECHTGGPTIALSRADAVSRSDP